MCYVTNPRVGAPEGTENGSWLPAVEGKTGSLLIISLCYRGRNSSWGNSERLFGESGIRSGPHVECRVPHQRDYGPYTFLLNKRHSKCLCWKGLGEQGFKELEVGVK